MSLAHSPLLAGLSSLHLPLRREDLHGAALDALGQTLAFVDDTPQGPMLAPQLADLVRHHLATPTPPPAPPISGFAAIGHPAARRVGAEALRDSVLLALQTGQADLGQSVVALVSLARAAVPDAAAAAMIGEIEAARRRHARGSAADDVPSQTRMH
jgi:hypothetical protein